MRYASIALIGLLTTQPVLGATTYGYSIDPNSSNIGDTVSDSGPTPVAGYAESGSPTVTPQIWEYGTGRARSDMGGNLGSKATQLYAVSGTLSAGNTVESHSTVRIDDIVISGPGATTSVDVALNLLLGGNMYGRVGQDIEMSGTVTSRITIATSINGVSEFGDASLEAEHTQGRFPNPGTSFRVSDSGLFEDLLTGASTTPLSGYEAAFDVDVSDFLATNAVTVPVGTPFAVEVDFAAFAGAGGVGGQFAEAKTDFFNSLVLNPTSVFSLPLGYTANGGDIVNNQIGVVPLPAAVWLLGSGLIGLLGVARCTRRESGIPATRSCAR